MAVSSNCCYILIEIWKILVLQKFIYFCYNFLLTNTSMSLLSLKLKKLNMPLELVKTYLAG